MTDSPRLSDVPQPSRPWTSNREERAQSPDDWYLFGPGEMVRCPRCSGKLTEMGLGQGVAIRIHPDQRSLDGRLAPATSFNGEAYPCPHCKKHLDSRTLPLARSA